jgi:Flp pilus assembly protein TadD
LFEAAVKKAPKNAGFVNDLGVTYMNLNRLEDAMETFNEGLELEPDNENLKENLVALNSHFEYREEMARLREQRAKRRAKETEAGEAEVEEPYRPGMYKNPHAPAKQKQPEADDEFVARPTRAKGDKKKEEQRRKGEHTTGGARPISDTQLTDKQHARAAAAAAAEVEHAEGGSTVPSYDPPPAAAGEDAMIDAFETARESIAQGYDLGREDDYVGAIPFFQAAIDAFPDNAGWLSDFGVTLLRAHELDRAKEVLDEAMRLEPGNASYKANRKALQQHLDYRDMIRKEAQEAEMEQNM